MEIPADGLCCRPLLRFLPSIAAEAQATGVCAEPIPITTYRGGPIPRASPFDPLPCPTSFKAHPNPGWPALRVGKGGEKKEKQRKRKGKGWTGRGVRQGWTVVQKGGAFRGRESEIGTIPHMYVVIGCIGFWEVGVGWKSPRGAPAGK